MSKSSSIPISKQVPGLVESPIEAQFFDALWRASGSIGATRVVKDNTLAHRTILKRRHRDSRYRVVIVPQFYIDKYRVDFVVVVIDEEAKRCGKCGVAQMFVECDGHDFHEKTKEQAARDKTRDRALTSYMPGFHFTGSEIYRDALSCAWSCLEQLQKKARA